MTRKGNSYVCATRIYKISACFITNGLILYIYVNTYHHEVYFAFWYYRNECCIPIEISVTWGTNNSVYQWLPYISANQYISDSIDLRLSVPVTPLHIYDPVYQWLHMYVTQCISDSIYLRLSVSVTPHICHSAYQWSHTCITQCISDFIYMWLSISEILYIYDSLYQWLHISTIQMCISDLI